MKLNYRGFEIDVNREKCMAGYQLLYFSVYRKSDGYELICSFTEGDDTIRDYIGFMRDRVDGFISDPGEEILPASLTDDPGEIGTIGAEQYTKVLAEHRAENEKTEIMHAGVRSSP